MIKYMVRLSPTDREQLSMLVTTGRAAAAKLRRARVLLKADIEAGERRWTDTEIAEALETSESTVQRVRQAWVDQGLERRWFVSGPPAGNIASSTGSRRPSSLPWPVAPLQKAACGGLSSYWPTSWSNWTSLTVSVRNVSARRSKKRPQTVAAQTGGHSPTGQCGLCLCHGRCLRGLYAAL